MISGHVLNVLVHHVKPHRFRLAIAPDRPRVLVAVVTLCFRRRRHHATGRRRRHPVLVDTSYHYTGYHFAQSVGQQHLQVHPDRSLKRVHGGSADASISISFIRKRWTSRRSWVSGYLTEIVIILLCGRNTSTHS